MHNFKFSSKKISVLGIFLGIIFVLGIFENTVAPVNIPGVRFGFSNIVIMYVAFYMGKKEAVLLNLLKSVFALAARGITAGILSLAGSMFSIFIILLLIAVFKKRLSYMLLSVFGAAAHNLGQIFVAAALMGNRYVFYYLPLLLICATITGTLTGLLLKITLPHLSKINN